jgi:CHASE2 domain-containing sensor protein
LRTALHPLPFLGLVVLLVAWRGRPPEPIAATLALYAAALAPYVLAAYYLRYLLPLTPALVLFAFLGADALAAAALRERPPR